jgi:hypothetical protein
MGRIRDLLNDVAHRIGLAKALLNRARRRHKALRMRAEANHEGQLKAQMEADELRAEGDLAAAEWKDKVAGRCEYRAIRSHNKALYWKGQIKLIMRKLKKLGENREELEAELAAWIAEHGVQIQGNKATGGTPKQRWIAVCIQSVKNCADGTRRNFYSQLGGPDFKHEIAPGPKYGKRSDCSSIIAGWAWSADLPDPNGGDYDPGATMYTGTLVGGHNGWKQVGEAEMKRRGWGFVIYGGGTGHHVEAYIGPGDRTAGHGSPPVDFGAIDLFGDGDYRCFVLAQE